MLPPPFIDAALLLSPEPAQVQFAPQATDRHSEHDAEVDEKDGADGANHGPPCQSFVLERGRQREQRQMVRGQLEERLVDVLHAKAQPGVVRTGQAQVDRVEDVGGEEDVDQDVWITDADDREDGVKEPAGQEDRCVESLSCGVHAHAQVETANLCPSCLVCERLALTMEHDCEVNRQYDENEEQNKCQHTVNDTCLASETDYIEGEHHSQAILQVALQNEAKN